MRRALSIALIAFGLAGSLASPLISTAEAQAPHAVVVEIDEPIQPSTANFLERVVNEAEDGGARFVVIRLDTPGGLYDSTRDIVETILESEIPVIVYVSPSGAQAASAGTFIATAGHITVMANGTTIGAASPVDQRGGPLPEPLGSKATNDAAAFLRSIAVERGLNADALNDTVTRAQAYSASEALNENVINFVAKDLEQLLSTVDGQRVDLFDGSSYVIETSGIELRTVDKTILERFLAIISNPNVAFLLLVIGAIGLFIEFLAPGLFAPGIIGVIFLVMAFVAFGNLPVNWVGLALIAFALLLMFAELKSPGMSFFGAGGVVSFVLGSVLLFGGFTFQPPGPIETPSFRVNYWLIGGVTVALAGLLIFVVRDILLAQRLEERQATKGITTAALVGTTGVVSAELAPSGMVFVSGEEWSAVSDTGDSIEEGAEVVVTEIDGLTLKVYKTTE